MRYWDTSAIVPLVAPEPSSDEIQDLFRSDPVIVTWWSTRVECASALSRKVRESDGPEWRSAGLRLARLVGVWVEIRPDNDVRTEAESAVGRHGLRAADAFQLGAALVALRLHEGVRHFVCLDNRLREAAIAEGFAVLP